MDPTLGPIVEDPALRQRLQAWQDAQREVARLRMAALPAIDTGAAIRAFAGAYRLARATRPTRLTSGLVEQQRWFARAHGRPA